jgi:hypothetical protein
VAEPEPEPTSPEPEQVRPEPFDELRTAPVEGPSSSSAGEPGPDEADADTEQP